jgi:hypothetical protein
MTTESPRIRYLALIDDEKIKRDKFFNVKQLVADVAKVLSENPESFSFANCTVQTTHRFPAKVGADAQRWPSADTIQAALNGWLKAREDAIWLWERMTPSERHGLQPPLGWKSAAA